MRNLSISLVAVGLLVIMAFAQKAQEQKAQELVRTAHYQLVSASVAEEMVNGSEQPVPTVFLLNTDTGQAWRFAAAHSVKLPGKPDTMQWDGFFPVEWCHSLSNCGDEHTR